MQPNEKNTTLEVHKLAEEVKVAIRKWFYFLQEPANAKRAANVQKHLHWLVKKKPKTLPPRVIAPGKTVLGETIAGNTSST